MRYSLATLALTASLALACGELHDEQSWTRSREMGGSGGTIRLDLFELTVGREAVPEGTLVRLVELLPGDHPTGNLAPAYEIQTQPDAPLATSSITYTIPDQGLPQDTYLVELTLAREESGQWLEIPTEHDGINGSLFAWIDTPGVYTIVKLQDK